MAFKFACPKCQQHFECDEAYRGATIPCPACHANIVVPSATIEAPAKLSIAKPNHPPPTASPKPQSSSFGATSFQPKAKVPPSWLWFAGKTLLGVVLCAVIIYVVAGRLLRVNSTTASPESSQAAPANPGKQTPELEQAEKTVLEQIPILQAARKQVETAEQRRLALHNFYHGKNLDHQTYNAVLLQYKAAEDEINKASAVLGTANSNFEKAMETYEKNGGQVDYRTQAH